MYYRNEQARTQRLTATKLLRQTFPAQSAQGVLDGEFFSADRIVAIGFAGLPSLDERTQNGAAV